MAASSIACTDLVVAACIFLLAVLAVLAASSCLAGFLASSRVFEQLYVGTSCVRNRRDILMLMRLSHVHDGRALTRNVVYSELLPSQTDWVREAATRMNSAPQ